MFKSNVGSFDRGMRIAAGLVVLSLFVMFPESEWGILALLGLIPLVTGIVGNCPLYSLFGLSTCTPAARPKAAPASKEVFSAGRPSRRK